MGRINGNFLTELFTPQQSGDGKSIANGGGIFGNPALYLRTNQGFNPATRQLGADDKNHPVEDGAKETFWVSKPADAKKIGENLLRENFGFDETDIQAYKKLYGEFTIFDSQECETAAKAGKSCTPATIEDIKNWKTANGKVSVELKPEMIGFLRKFRLERVVDKAVNNIADADLRESVRKDLMQIGASGEERIGAATRLMNIAGQDKSDLNLALQAIKTVADQPENKNNPITNILAARVRLDEAANSQNSRVITEAKRQLTNAVRLAQGQDAQTGEFSKDARINRAEAAWTNRQAAALLRKTGNYPEADKREMMARYYEVDDGERARFENAKFTDLSNLPRWKDSDSPSVRQLAQAETDWREYQLQNNPANRKKDLSEDPFKRVWTVPKYYGEKNVAEVTGEGDAVRKPQDFKGKVFNRPLVEFQRKGSLRVEGTGQVEQTTYFTKKGRIIPSGRPFDYSQSTTVNRTIRSPELNPTGTTNAMGLSGAAGMLKEYNKWATFGIDYKFGITQKRIALRDKLEKDNFNATNYPVPPKPEDLPKERQKLVRMFGADKKAEARINEVMRDLKERSYAFWGRK